MSREIKFRAWDKVNKKMVKVGNLHFDQVGEFSFPIDVNGNVVNHCPVMQYTGLKDKNGKEIYEGDILSGANAEYLWKVEWGKGEHCDSWQIICIQDNNELPLWPTLDEEVIGNIYENPELLK